MHTVAAPGGDTATFLIHLFGSGLDADDRFVVERFRSLACGDIVPADPGPHEPAREPGARKGRRKPRRTVLPRRAVEKIRPGRDEIVIATGLSRSGGIQVWGSRATGLFVERRQRR